MPPDGLHLDVDLRHILTARRSGAHSLVLDGLAPGDGGQYLCYALSPVGSASTLARVTVEGEGRRPAIPPFIPMFTLI